jgi:hypothetical protein
MLLIFGMRNRAHQHGACVAASCPRCHNEVVLTYLVVTRWFTLFFVPLIPIGGRHRMLVCPICSWRREVPKESEHLALEMIDITRQWQAHQLADAEYGKRVEAFWSFLSADATGARPSAPHPPNHQSDQPPSPPAPPAA